MTFYPKSIITLQNNGTAVANNPHSVLNLIRMVGADSGGGVATLSSVPASSSIAYGAATFTFTSNVWALFVGASGSGATTVNAPPVTGVVGTGWAFAVTDSGATSLTNQITVNGNGHNIEDPNSPGTFSASVLIKVNSGSVIWTYDGTHWKISNLFYPTSGGSSGVTVQNNGTGIANNPHTTLNLIGSLLATDAGAGVAQLLALPTTVSAAYGTTTSLTAATQVVILTGGSGVSTVNTPAIGAPLATGWFFGVVDSGANSLNNNITVSSSGPTLEDPNSPGTFAASVLLRINSGTVFWVYDGTHWKIAYTFYPSKITVFVSTTNSGPLTFFSYPLTTGNVVSLKTRWSMRDTVTISNTTHGEAAHGGYNTGGVVTIQTVTGSGNNLPGSLIWRTGAGNITATTAGGGNQISLQLTGGTGTNLNHWRLDIEPVLST